jgi:hypothetical protein
VTQKLKKAAGRFEGGRPAVHSRSPRNEGYELHVQLQPSSQFSQQPQGQSQLGHPLQQFAAQQPPAVHSPDTGAAVVPAKPANHRDDAMANGPNTLVIIRKLTFWLMSANAMCPALF